MKVVTVSKASKFLHGLSTLLIFSSILAFSNPRSPSNPKLAGQIEQLLQKELLEDSTDTKTASAARHIFLHYGIPSSTLVGPQAAQDYVVLAAHDQPLVFLQRLLPKLEEAADGGQVPADSLSYLKARIRQKQIEESFNKPPANPMLRDRIEELFKIDQAVRQNKGFDPAQMHQVISAALFRRRLSLRNTGCPRTRKLVQQQRTTSSFSSSTNHWISSAVYCPC